jgi:membrane associated rhomboid family serine protease
MTLILIIVTIIISVMAFSRPDIFDKLKFNAYRTAHQKEYWRLLTYGFVHADWVHLGVNMFVLFSFGSVVSAYFEVVFAGKDIFYYLLLYFGGLFISAAPGFGKHKENIYYNAVGASGAVSAIVFSSIVFDPMNKIYLFLIPIGIPAILFGILYLVYSAYMDKKGSDNIGHDAHFWGGIYGFVFTIILKPDLFFHFLSQIFG